MHIRLTYDPIKPETVVAIDGQPTDKNDIYGFLYPVRHCLLQTWLKPSGSWQGLARQIRELARGEDVQLTFAGREQDLADLENALREESGLTLSFEPLDPAVCIRSLFARAEGLLEEILDKNLPQEEGKKTANDLFPHLAEQIEQAMHGEDAPWCVTVAGDGDLRRADQTPLACCLVAESYLDGYEKLEKLNRLTRSMRRSGDMICCVISDDAKRADFEHYAKQYDFRDIRFAKDEEGKDRLWEKYGVCWSLRIRLAAYHRAGRVLADCAAQRGALEALTGTPAGDHPTVAQIRENARNKLRLNWLKEKAPLFAAYAALLEEHAYEKEMARHG